MPDEAPQPPADGHDDPAGGATSLPKNGWQRLRERLTLIFGSQQSRETTSLIIAAIVVGLLTGLAAVGFSWLVENMDLIVARARLAAGTALGALVGVIVPAVGGLVITPIVVAWAPDARGSGIPTVILAVSRLGGRVPKRLLIWRPLASAISIGTGASLGSEGPVVQLGGALASALSELFKLNEERRRNLVAVAAAGGIAATFNAPIAGVLFALEELLGQFHSRYFASVVIGAVSATAVSRILLGTDPAFVVPDYGLNSALELPLYLVMGLACGLVAAAFLRLIARTEDGFDRLRLSPWIRPMVGGLLIGVVALIFPQVLGRGYEETGLMLQNASWGVGLLLALCLAKMLATSLSLASWASGGIFAPSLFVGASFGAAFGQLGQTLFPQLVHAPGAYALVSMAAVFAGVVRAPMTALVLVFEMSGSYNLILPLLLAAVIATLVADVLQPESYYHWVLSRRGLHLLRLPEIDVLQTVRVREVMDREVPTIPADATLDDLADTMLGSHHHGFVVTDPDDPARMIGIVTLTDLERARQTDMPASTQVGAICQRQVHYALPDESASEVLERMAQLGIGRMPVVDPNHPDRPIGYVRQTDLARAYYLALQRERQAEEVHETLRLRDLTGQEIVEVRVPPGSRLAGKALREAGLPSDSIIVAIRRRGRTLFPHGDTVIQVGDVVVANVAPGRGPAFRKLFAEAPAEPASSD